MTDKHSLTRETIIQTLAEALEPLAYVHAFWEGGAAALNRIDDWSDLDFYITVDDEKVDEAFLAIEKALKSLSPLKQVYEILQLPSPGLSQKFYKLERASEYHIIDLVVMKLSSPEKLLEPEVHGNAVFYFNKSSKLKTPSLDKDKIIERLQKRLERLKARFDLFNMVTQKEINRGNYLEAIDTYHILTLASLVEALRITYNPLHHDFKMRYIHYELPSEVIKKLKRLYFVESEKELQEKYHEATKWFQEVISQIDRKMIEETIRKS
jgi:hypothetical protein